MQRWVHAAEDPDYSKKEHASEKLSLVVRRGLEREEIENRQWARQEVRGARLRKCQLKLEKKWEGSQKP